MHHILYVEDDKNISRLTTQILAPSFHVSNVQSEKELEEQLKRPTEFQLLLLDRIIGSIDMRDKIPELRQRYGSVPILILSAISTPNEKADLLNREADDYIGKPYSPDELLARINSLLRRSADAPSSRRVIGNTVLDSNQRTISVNGHEEVLSTKSFLILNCLTLTPGKIWSRKALLESVWGSSDHAEENLVETTMAHVRKRLASLGCSFKIRNTRGVGYWLEN